MEAAGAASRRPPTSLRRRARVRKPLLPRTKETARGRCSKSNNKQKIEKQIRGVDDDDDDDDDDDENHLPRRLDITNFLCGRGPSPNPRYNYDGSDDENDDDDDVVVTPVMGGGARQQRGARKWCQWRPRSGDDFAVRPDESRQQLEERVRGRRAPRPAAHRASVCDEAFPPGVPTSQRAITHCRHHQHHLRRRAGAAGSSSSSSSSEEEEEEEAACSSGGTVAERKEECDEACVAGQLAEHIAKRLRVPSAPSSPAEFTMTRTLKKKKNTKQEAGLESDRFQFGVELL